MRVSLKIIRLDDGRFQLIQWDHEREEIVERIQTFKRLGIMVDTQFDDNWTGLKCGKYEMCKEKFDEFVEKFKCSSYPEMADNVRLYDATTLSNEEAQKLLTHSGILKTTIENANPPLNYIRGSSWDEAEVIE